MADFSTTVDVSPSSSSLRETEQTIQSELGSLTVDVQPESTGAASAGGGGSLSTGLAAGSLAGTTDLLGEGVKLDSERNSLLHEIRDFAERGAMGGGGESGGGVMDTLLPVGILSAIGSGSLALSAASVLTVTGSLGLAATGVLSVVDHLELNAANVLAVTGTLGVAATSAIAMSGALSLSATSVLAVTGVLGLGAAGVLAVSGALGLDVSNVLGVTGAISLSASAVMAVTGALSLPATGVLAVTGALSIAAADILNVKFGGKPVDNEYTGKDGELTPYQGTATRGLDGPQSLSDAFNATQTTDTDGLSPAELQEAGMAGDGVTDLSSTSSNSTDQSNSGGEEQTFGGTNRNSTIGGHNRSSTIGGQNTTQSEGDTGGHARAPGNQRNQARQTASNQARASSQKRPEVNYSPTFNVDLTRLERKMEQGLQQLKSRIKNVESTLDSIERRRR